LIVLSKLLASLHENVQYKADGCLP
jgi:hypothetical protein